MKRGPKLTMTLEDLPDNWQEFLLNGMGYEGWQLQEAITFLARKMEKRGFNYKIHARFCRDYEEYKDIIDEGRMSSEAWWWTQIRMNIKNRDFNNTLAIFTLKACFGANDKPATPTPNGTTFGDVVEKAELMEKFRPKELAN